MNIGGARKISLEKCIKYRKKQAKKKGKKIPSSKDIKEAYCEKNGKCYASVGYKNRYCKTEYEILENIRDKIIKTIEKLNMEILLNKENLKEIEELMANIKSTQEKMNLQLGNPINNPFYGEEEYIPQDIPEDDLEDDLEDIPIVVDTILYDRLGVEPDASQEEIKKQYKKLALYYHPDKPTGSTEKIKEINKAYQILSDPFKRDKYDRFGINITNVQGFGCLYCKN